MHNSSYQSDLTIINYHHELTFAVKLFHAFHGLSDNSHSPD